MSLAESANVPGSGSESSCRYKEHTGKSLEALEQETARKAQLQYQKKAQVETVL